MRVCIGKSPASGKAEEGAAIRLDAHHFSRQQVSVPESLHGKRKVLLMNVKVKRRQRHEGQYVCLTID
jgi:hypothetical protein